MSRTNYSLPGDREFFLGPRHPATARYLYPADPAALFGITHALACSGFDLHKKLRESRSLRDFKSAAALLLTIVLSETWKPIALFGHAGGPSVFFEPDISRPMRLLETHPRPCVSIGNRSGFPATDSLSCTRDASCRVHSF